MKKTFLVLAAAALMTACNDSGNSGDPIEQKIDSTKERADSLKKMTDSSFEKKIDSLEQRQEELKDKHDSAEKRRIDSLEALKKQNRK